jgi:hypothetical protein
MVSIFRPTFEVVKEVQMFLTGKMPGNITPSARALIDKHI